MDHTRNQYGDSSERLAAAVHILATHPEEVRRRLYRAAEYLAMVAPGSLPESLRDRWKQIRADLTQFDPKPEEGVTAERRRGSTCPTVTLRKIRKKTAADIAERIFQLQSELDWAIQIIDAAPERR